MDISIYKKVARAAKGGNIKYRNYSKTKEPTYSGRGMFGNKTHALIVNRYDIGDFDEVIKSKLGNKVFADLRIDNLGLDYIVY